MHNFMLDALPGDGDGLGNCMQTKLTADSNVSGDTNISTIKTDAMLIKPTTIDTDAMSAKPVGGTLAMLTNVDTLKEELGPSKEKELGPSTEKPGGLQEVEPGAGAALADGTDVENLEDKVQVVITEDEVAGAEQARRP